MPDAALDALTPEDREAAERWLWRLGFEAGELDACPPLRLVVDTLAVISVAATFGPGVSRDEAWRRASEELGIRSPIRTWYRWQRAALDSDNLSEDDSAEATLKVAESTVNRRETA